MPFIVVNPDYRAALASQGLRTAGDFLRLGGVIISGHPDRHAARLSLNVGGLTGAFLKKEHRVPWRDRLAGAWAGHGFVSKSYREYQMLCRLRQAGIGCPEPVAAGEERGQAFLLLREVPAAVDLRTYLTQVGDRRRRRAVAWELGIALARIHAIGFDHPDLYSKHILAAEQAQTGVVAFHFLDWQRSRHRRHLSWTRRWRNLAALDATIAGDLAGPRDRLDCLRAYLLGVAGGTPRLAKAARAVRGRAAALLRKRRIRELRQPPLAPGLQNLIWLDGEALCLTREFRSRIGDRLPPYLILPRVLVNAPRRVWHALVALPDARQASLVRRSSANLLRWVWAWLRRRPAASPELRQAGDLFRLQRYGVATPTLLAVGERHGRPGRTESFLLTEAPAGARDLRTWLTGLAGRPLLTAERKRRWQVFRRAGTVLRRIHEAGYDLSAEALATVSAVQVRPFTPVPEVVLGSLDAVRPARRLGGGLGQGQLRHLHDSFAGLCSRTDALRFLLGYLGRHRPQHTERTPARRLVRRAVT